MKDIKVRIYANSFEVNNKQGMVLHFTKTEWKYIRKSDIIFKLGNRGWELIEEEVKS